jgi:anti-sigma B factor antagonist
VAESREKAAGGGFSMLQLSIQHSENVTTIWCKGRIVLGDHLDLLRLAALSQTKPEVMLDLSSVSLIDAAGLGTLLDLHERFQNSGRELELVDPSRFVYLVFRITRLETVFRIVCTRPIGVEPRSAIGKRSNFIELPGFSTAE